MQSAVQKYKISILLNQTIQKRKQYSNKMKAKYTLYIFKFSYEEISGR